MSEKIDNILTVLKSLPKHFELTKPEPWHEFIHNYLENSFVITLKLFIAFLFLYLCAWGLEFLMKGGAFIPNIKLFSAITDVIIFLTFCIVSILVVIMLGVKQVLLIVLEVKEALSQLGLCRNPSCPLNPKLHNAEN